MTLISRLRALVRNVVLRSRADRDLRDELQSYADLAEDEALGAGLDSDRARKLGRQTLGNAAATTEAVRQTRAGSGVARLGQDVSYALRLIRRSPGFATLTILILTLGIGSVATMFAVVDAAIFKPLPYRHPEQLVDIAHVNHAGTAEATRQLGTSWSDLDWWRTRRDLFSASATYGNARAAVIADVPVVGVTTVARVSPELLQMFGVRPLRGRWFLPSDGEGAVTLVSEAFWRRDLGADANVVGRTLTINRVPRTIVGVMPATFSMAVGNNGTTIAWTPFDERIERRVSGVDGAVDGAPTVFRIRDGLDLPTATRAAQAAVRSLAGAAGDRGDRHVELVPLDSRQWLKTTNQSLLPVMLGVVSLVLIIACANVANLLLARAVTRRRELAVRAALGASRGRLIRQMVTEGFVLTLLGGCGGVGLAAIGTAVLPGRLPPQLGLFNANPMELDGRVLAVSAAAVALTTLLCSVVPAMRASRTDVLDALEGGVRAVGSRSGQRIRYGLQVVEIALTLVLVCGTTLLASSFIHMVWSPPGYRLEGLSKAGIALPSARYATPAVQTDFYDRLMAQVRNVPGVEAATFGQPPPLGGGGLLVAKNHERDHQTSMLPVVSLYWVDPDYFDVVGVPIRMGRSIAETDVATSPPVALIDEDTARRFWPGESPIGHEFRYSSFMPWITVVGVTGRAKTKAFTTPAGTAQAYMPQAQNSSQASRTLLIRSGDADPLAPMAGARAALHALDPSVELNAPQVVADLYNDAFVQPRLYVVLMLIFASLSALTAAVGLFGLLNYSVSQRHREIGVRIALGAALGDIRRLVLRDAATAVAVGLAIGLVSALLLARLLQSLVYGISVHDVPSYAAAVVALVVMAAVATLIPARRATRVDPVQALRVD